MPFRKRIYFTLYFYAQRFDDWFDNLPSIAQFLICSLFGLCFWYGLLAIWIASH